LPGRPLAVCVHVMRHLLPKPVERVALKVAYRLRKHWRQIARPQLHAITVIIRDPAGRVLFIRHSYGPANWTLPSGGIARKEAPEDAARREMHEELGVSLGEMTAVDTFEETVSGAPQTAHVFTAAIEDEPQPDGREVIAAQFFALDQLPDPLSVLTRRRLDAYLRMAG